jgi:hypothetical protein
MRRSVSSVRQALAARVKPGGFHVGAVANAQGKTRALDVNSIPFEDIDANEVVYGQRYGKSYMAYWCRRDNAYVGCTTTRAYRSALWRTGSCGSGA